LQQQATVEIEPQRTPIRFTHRKTSARPPWVLRAQSAVDRTPIAATIQRLPEKEKGRALRVL
jgi:hypothetical protein